MNKKIFFSLLLLETGNLFCMDINVARTFTLTNNTNTPVWVTNQSIDYRIKNRKFVRLKKVEANKPIDGPFFRGVQVPAHQTRILKEPIPNLYIYLLNAGTLYELKYQVTLPYTQSKNITLNIQDIISGKILDGRVGSIVLKTFKGKKESTQEYFDTQEEVKALKNLYQ